MSDAKKEFLEQQIAHGVTEFHACMGLNSCAQQGRDGSGDMAGTGQCATIYHSCHGANDCRGQGGCGTLGTPEQQGVPGDNECRAFGSCAVPINEGRILSAGVDKGKSVWQLARQRFEQRMYTIGKPFGPSPGEGIPDDEVPRWAATEGSSCS